MIFTIKKFFDAELPNDNAGGGEIDSAKENVVAQAEVAELEKPEQSPKQIITDEELKRFGFDSPDALKTFLQKSKEDNISDEEKREKENIEKANFLKFSAENKLLQIDDLSKFESLKSKSDRDLVFEKYKEDYKADHPEIEDENELNDAAEEDFNYEYKLNSTSEAAKKRGESKLAKEAKELRMPFESKITTAQEQYKENKNIRETYPKFEKFVDESISKNAPDKIVAQKIKIGDEEIDIEIELTKEDREAMAKAFKTPKTFQMFTTGKPEEIQSKVDSKMQGWLKVNKANAINEKIFEVAKGVALKESSNIGANNPFALQKGVTANTNSEETLEESNQRIAEARRRYSLRK